MLILTAFGILSAIIGEVLPVSKLAQLQ